MFVSTAADLGQHIVGMSALRMDLGRGEACARPPQAQQRLGGDGLPQRPRTFDYTPRLYTLTLGHMIDESSSSCIRPARLSQGSAKYKTLTAL